MIQIAYTNNYIEVSGHANFDEKGKDIVCAGVSAIVMGAISWFEQTDIVLEIDKKQAKIKIILLKKNKNNLQKIQLIIIQLKALEQNYRKYINFKKDE